MSMNFYMVRNACPACGHSDEQVHIGKSSAGWCFALHVMPEEGISDLGDWKREWSKPNTFIRDEYGNVVTAAEMLAVITKRSWPRARKGEAPAGYTSWAEFHLLNGSVRGPKHLLRHRVGRCFGPLTEPLRHRVDGAICTGHGKGTWDLMLGEFS